MSENKNNNQSVEKVVEKSELDNGNFDNKSSKDGDNSKEHKYEDIYIRL